MQMFSKIIFKILGGKNMVDLYVCLIINGRRTFEQVPVKFQSAVHADLLAMGLDDNGNIIVA